MNWISKLVSLNVMIVCGSEVPTLAAEIRPPNIVMIIADDQGYDDFGFMGNSQVSTPHLDRLAANSARYVNGYLPTSVCRPSLATLLTGLYPHQHGIHFNHPPPGFARLSRDESMTAEQFERLRERAMVFIKSVPTLPRLLAEHGYQCLQTGKHWEGHWRNAGFTRGMTTARPSAGSKYGNLTLANMDVVAHGNGDHGLAIGRETMQPIEEFIDDCGDSPFLVWYAPFLPHTPHDSPEKFTRPFEGNSEIAEHLKPYYASIAQFDDTVGQLVTMIEQHGLADQTLFLFVSDNGWKPSKDRAGSDYAPDPHAKRSPFDAGVRTPVLIRWDGQVTPATHDELISSVDVMPTLLDAVGIEWTDLSLPGISLLPSARGEQDLDPQRAVFGEIYPGDASSLGHPSLDIAYRFVRQGELKLIVPHSHNGESPWRSYLKREALFNVVSDPVETQNLIDDPGHADSEGRLCKMLDEWWTPSDDSHLPQLDSD
ncbi:MAG: sulfatase-like hydrolase/transferase [Planctomycetaceae bacterium]